MLKPILHFGMFVLVTISSAVAQQPENVRPLSAPNDHQWVIRWNRSDDFNGGAIDWRKWQARPEKFNAWRWDNDANTAVSNGVLTITARHHPENGPSDYSSGMLKSYAQGTYGYYEARIKGAHIHPGLCPAFWLYSPIDDSLLTTGTVRYSEIDIVEMTQRGNHVAGNERILDLNLHAIRSNGKKGPAGRDWQRPEDPRFKEAQATMFHAPFDPRTDFHTYGCEVDRHWITWYVDGKQVGRKANTFWHRRMNVALSLGLRAPFTTFQNNRLEAVACPKTNELPSSMAVDYLRVWERVPAK